MRFPDYKNILCNYFLFIVALLVFGCGANDPIDTVKNGTLEFDKSVTIDGAFNGYDYFGNKDWKVFHDKQGRTIVRFRGNIKIRENKYLILVQTFEKKSPYTLNRIEAISKEYFRNKDDFIHYFNIYLDKLEFVAFFTINKDDKSKFSLASDGLISNLYNNKPFEINDSLGFMLKSILNNNPKLLVIATDQFLNYIENNLPRLSRSFNQIDLGPQVQRIAEKIRAAHLNKDINKWLSCYSSSYPNLGQLENRQLELWKSYDIKEVSYHISDVQQISPKEAKADIVWNIQLYDQRNHDYTLVRQKYQIALEKGPGGWKISNSKEMAGG
jgi:hypothetical protein